MPRRRCRTCSLLAQSTRGFLRGRCQRAMEIWRGRATVNWPAGASLTIVLPPPIVAPAPIVIGATSTQFDPTCTSRSEEHTSELQSHVNLVCRLLLEKKKNNDTFTLTSCIA